MNSYTTNLQTIQIKHYYLFDWEIDRSKLRGKIINIDPLAIAASTSRPNPYIHKNHRARDSRRGCSCITKRQCSSLWRANLMMQKRPDDPVRESPENEKEHDADRAHANIRFESSSRGISYDSDTHRKDHLIYSRTRFWCCFSFSRCFTYADACINSSITACCCCSALLCRHDRVVSRDS